MTDVTKAPLERRLPARGEPRDADALLERFLSYLDEVGLSLYPAQEEAILEIFAGNNVVLSTPTGSGKSLVALAALFKTLAEHRYGFYTAPIKALVTEKFFDLCRVLGPKNVGMLTGDAAVNRDAPVICCTAEILANVALREGAEAQADVVVMDEFHYYADRERGVAWQLPLLTLPQSRFLLMSATLGDADFFVQELKRRTKAPAKLVASNERPVPLDFQYSESPLHEAVMDLSAAGKAPVYIVHFSQRAASERAQDLMSLNFLSKEEKLRIKEELKTVRFDSPFGKELARYVPHGIGVHHAGMLPKYRRLVERLAQQGLLHVICGTDTLGVGVNVPIRTVLFTQLCKFDGENVGTLKVRDFLQIAGRAGRRGFDTRGSVVVQAPEHVIENKRMKARAAGDAKKEKKLKLKRPPEVGYKEWNSSTFDTLRQSAPERLKSSFRIDHGMILSLFSGSGGYQLARRILRTCHESPAQKRALLREGFSLFRSLVAAGVLTVEGSRVRVSESLQADFSMNQALSLYAMECIQALDREAPEYALQVLSTIEAIVESPAGILRRQVDVLKTQAMGEMKAQGMEYDERMAALEKIEHPKPEAEFLYATFNLFAKNHPWVSGYNVAPKSIARDMHEQAASFHQYVKDYGLARLEGVLLRYLTDVYRALKQTVPDSAKTPDLEELEAWLAAELRQVDASLLEEWERLEGAGGPREELPAAQDKQPADITRDTKSFSILVRNAVFRVVQDLARRQYDRVLSDLMMLAPSGAIHPKDGADGPWTEPRIEQAMAGYWEQHPSISLDASARSAARVELARAGETLRVRQVLSDPEGNGDWALEFAVDLTASREEGRVVASLVGIGDE